MRTRSVDKFLFKNYLAKAREFNQAAKTAYENGMYNAAVVNAVHCAVNAVDALTVFYKGVRHAGERHEDAVTLLQTLPVEREDINKKSRQLSRLLSIKTAAEYHETLLTKKDAGSALKDSKRLIEWAEGALE
jgi:HEPN domain-containing protein